MRFCYWHIIIFCFGIFLIVTLFWHLCLWQFITWGYWICATWFCSQFFENLSGNVMTVNSLWNRWLTVLQRCVLKNNWIQNSGESRDHFNKVLERLPLGAGLHNSESSKGQIINKNLLRDAKFYFISMCRFRCSMEQIIGRQLLYRSRAFAEFLQLRKLSRPAGRMLFRSGSERYCVDRVFYSYRGADRAHGQREDAQERTDGSCEENQNHRGVHSSKLRVSKVQDFIFGTRSIPGLDGVRGKKLVWRPLC